MKEANLLASSGLYGQPVSQSRWTRWSPADWILLAGLVLLACVWILLRFQWHATPTEDAAMLLRYAENFAGGHGVRWNIDGAPVDGATDFLFMIATGGLARVAHVGVVTACRVLVLAAQIFSIALVFGGARRILGGNRWLCAAMAIYLMAGPGNKMADSCFGAPVFAASLLCCWCAALLYANRGAGTGYAVLMASFALLSGLIRPEGVVVAVIFLAATVCLTGIRRAVPLIAVFVSVFVVLGGSYFLWRWHYFGAPLPNPFYVKGNGHLYPSSVASATKNVGELLFPVLPLIPFGYLSSRTRRLTGSLCFVLISFILMWVLLNNWNNHYMRFQYAIVPVVLFTIPGLLTDLKAIGLPDWSALPVRARGALALAGILATLGSAGYIEKKFYFWAPGFGMRLLAQRLQPFASHGHTMAVTEAGVISLYSRWHVIDGLGLNDSYIAHHGAGSITEYLEKQTPPDVIMIRVDGHVMPRAEILIALKGGEPIRGTPSEAFTRMGLFATEHHYDVAAAYGSDPCDLIIFWLRPGIADHDAILHAIRDSPFYFLDNGELSTDYREHLPPPALCGQPPMDEVGVP